MQQMKQRFVLVISVALVVGCAATQKVEESPEGKKVAAKTPKPGGVAQIVEIRPAAPEVTTATPTAPSVHVSGAMIKVKGPSAVAVLYEGREWQVLSIEGEVGWLPLKDKNTGDVLLVTLNRKGGILSFLGSAESFSAAWGQEGYGAMPASGTVQELGSIIRRVPPSIETASIELKSFVMADRE